MRVSGWTAALCWLGTANAQTYIKAEACGVCHPAQFERQSRSGHARSLYRAAEHPLAASFVPSGQLVRPPGYRFQFSRQDRELRVKAFDAENVLEIPIEWGFGAGNQAVTFVTRVNEDWYLEHYYSYYTALRTLGPTPGHEAVVPKTLPEAMGLPYRSLQTGSGIKGCFECHSTGPVAIGPKQEIQPAELGVRCEACHGAGSVHSVAAKRGGNAKNNIERPGRGVLADMNRACGVCHRPPPADGATIDWSYAWNVRHQPVYLTQSACFRQSKGALSCVTCHDPHDPLARNAASYNQRCQSCHNGDVAKSATPACMAQTPANCVDCHMPRVSPQAGLGFSNHWIGVYGSGAKLKPTVR